MSDTEQLDALVNRLVNATEPAEVKATYRQWAATYDDDLDSFGYVAPQIGTALFSEVVESKNTNIHDAGCGTGLVGKLLASLGYNNIDGSDFSPEMLDRARDTGCYQQLQQADFSQLINLPDNSYDGVISIGVYTKRFKNNFIAEMLRILVPSGHLLFSCRPLYYEEVADSIKQLHADEIINFSSIRLDNYMAGQGAKAFYVTLQKSNT